MKRKKTKKKFSVDVVIERSESITVTVEADSVEEAGQLGIDAALAGKGKSIDIQTMDASYDEVVEL